MTDFWTGQHTILTMLTAGAWAVVCVVSGMAAIYGGPHTDAYVDVEDKRKWWRRGLCAILCFATGARAFVVLDGSKDTTWDDIIIAVVLAIFAIFYWRRYINLRRTPDARDDA